MSYLNDYMTPTPETGAIFIDTLQCVRNIKDSNDYQQTYEEANSLKEVAYHYGIAIVIVHHTTKAIEGEDWANTIMGSTGLVAAAHGYRWYARQGNFSLQEERTLKTTTAPSSLTSPTGATRCLEMRHKSPSQTHDKRFWTRLIFRVRLE